MRRPPWRRLLAAPLLGALALCGACAKPAEKAVEYGPPVRGKVTYRGQAVPYGIVLFYAHGAGINPKAGQVAPAAWGEVRPDGSYEVQNAPVGPVMVVVACDPDADLAALTAPATFGGGMGGAPGAGGPPQAGGPPPGGPPMGGGPPMAGGPPAAGGPPQAGGPPTAGGPPQAGGPPMGGGGLPQAGPLPKGAPPPPKGPPNAVLEKLTAEQKRTLKAVHEKYGSVGKSELSFVVHKGEPALTFNIELK
jgi:hypothetical protein